MRYSDVLTVTTARAQLPRLIAATKEGQSPVIGSHRKPEAVLMHARILDVIDVLLHGLARAEADDLIREGHTRGDPIHPGDLVGRVAAWLWLSGQRSTLVDFIATLVGELRHHHPDAPEPRLRLADVLAGMTLALPGDFPDDQVRPLIETLRKNVPDWFSTHPDAP